MTDEENANWAELTLRIKRRHDRIVNHLEFKRFNKAAELQLKNVKDSVKLMRWITAHRANMKATNVRLQELRQETT